MAKIRLAIAADHAGLQLKAFLVRELSEYELVDEGPHSADSVDYPDFAAKACAKVTSGDCARAILVCGSGIGMSIAANKIDGIRAAHAESLFTAQLAGAHNNANVLCLGERITGAHHALAMVRGWMQSDFEPRHQRRVDKIHQLEKR